ncbi:MAG: PKD domain-containing protein [bacterium]|nr:PKD domain-containing protein [bacterium]
MKKGTGFLLLVLFSIFSIQCFNDGGSDSSSKKGTSTNTKTSTLEMGLIAHYKLDGNAADSAGESHGAVIGKALFEEDTDRSGVLHQKSIYTRVRVNPVVDLEEVWTITAWFKGLVDPGWKSLTRGNTKDYQVKIHGDGTLGTFGTDRDVQFRGCGYNTNAAAEGWHHVTAVGIEGTTRFYIDGEYVGTSDYQSTSEVYTVGGGNRFAEYIDEVRIYNRELNDDEIADLGDPSGPFNNHAPVLEPVDAQTAAEGEALYVPVAAGDIDGDVLLLTAIGLPAFAQFNDNGNGTGIFSFEPGYEDAGTYTMSLTVSDGELFHTQEITLTVSSVNRPPQVSAGGPYEVREGESLTALIAATDPDNDLLTISQTGMPGFGSFTGNGSGAGTVVFSPGYTDAGTYSFTVTVSDGDLSVPAVFTCIVEEVNRAPLAVIDALPEVAMPGAAGFSGAGSSDPDGDELTYTWDFGDGSGGAIGENVSYTYLSPGTCLATLTVEDGNGGTGIATAEITVTPPPDLEAVSVDTTGISIDPQTLVISGSADVEVKNNGTTSISGSYTVLLFVDSNGTENYEAGTDSVIGSVMIASGPAAGAAVVRSIPVGGDVVFAENIIYAFVDSNADIAEIDEDNNIIHNMVDCEYVPPVGGFDPVVEWSWNSSSTGPDYLNVMMTPAVIDLDGDSIPEVVFGATNSTGGSFVERGYLRALKGSTGEELFTVSDSSLMINTTSSIAAGDIDLDGKPEIIACDTTGRRLIVFEHDGTFKWRSGNLEMINWGAPAIADINNDGTPEIVLGRQVLNSEGTVLWTGTGGRGAIFGPLSFAADINLDGSLDVVAGNTVYNNDGTILWQDLSFSDGANAVANFDDDAYPEVVLVSDRSVRLLDHDGVLLWGPVAIPGGGRGGPPTVADFDNDGLPEIGVAGSYRYVVLDGNGSILWEADIQDKSSNCTGSSVFDFDGDGSTEVVYRDELYLRIYRGSDGTVLYEIPMSSCTWHEYVLVADVDNDNNAEIVAVANNNCGIGPQRGIYVIGDANDTWVNTRKIWNQHAYSITNINDDGTIPVTRSNNWNMFNNFRQNQVQNPFGCTDVTASYLRMNDSGDPVSVALTVRLGNGGALHVPSGIPVSFYDGDPKDGGSLIGTVSSSKQLNPGEYEDLSGEWSVLTGGFYTLYAVVDDNGSGSGSISETDEENNTVFGSFNIRN